MPRPFSPEKPSLKDVLPEGECCQNRHDQNSQNRTGAVVAMSSPPHEERDMDKARGQTPASMEPLSMAEQASLFLPTFQGRVPENLLFQTFNSPTEQHQPPPYYPHPRGGFVPALAHFRDSTSSGSLQGSVLYDPSDEGKGETCKDSASWPNWGASQQFLHHQSHSASSVVPVASATQSLPPSSFHHGPFQANNSANRNPEANKVTHASAPQQLTVTATTTHPQIRKFSLGPRGEEAASRGEETQLKILASAADVLEQLPIESPLTIDHDFESTPSPSWFDSDEQKPPNTANDQSPGVERPIKRTKKDGSSFRPPRESNSPRSQSQPVFMPKSPQQVQSASSLFVPTTGPPKRPPLDYPTANQQGLLNDPVISTFPIASTAEISKANRAEAALASVPAAEVGTRKRQHPTERDDQTLNPSMASNNNEENYLRGGNMMIFENQQSAVAASAIMQLADKQQQGRDERPRDAAAADDDDQQKDCPSESDVVCGRGNGVRQRPGNQAFLLLVTDYLGAYSRANSRVEKRLVQESILDALSNKGIRFWKEQEEGDGEGWSMLPREDARKKVGQLLRHLQRGNNKAKDATASEQKQSEESD